MTSWDYDTVFYRVFCITLLAVTFTFTLILTNVFVDIDGLLSNKEKAKPSIPSPKPISHDLSELSRAINVHVQPEDKPDYDGRDFQDSEELYNYRSKRSLEAPDRIFHIQDPKVKRLLTNHLANLLDELDEKNNNKNNRKTITNENDLKRDSKKQLKNTVIDKYNDIVNFNSNRNKDKELRTKDKEEEVSIKEYVKENKEELKINDYVNTSHKDYKAELLHLAMHNMIFQGIIENRNLDSVYKNVADLVMNFEKDHSELNKDELENLFKNVTKIKKRTDSTLDENKNVESVLRREFNNKRGTKGKETGNSIIQETTTDRNVIIKTIIDITAMSNDKTNKDSDLTVKDKINGIIKVIYNGNVIKFKRTDGDKTTNSKIIPNKLPEMKIGNTANRNNDDNHLGKYYENKLQASNQSYYQKIFYDYLKKLKGSDISEQEKVTSRKRFKRHVKVRNENKKTTVKPKIKEDDKLFVEIETHFDSKGMKGENKKKLIKDLIKKIQTAIHSDDNAQKKKQKHWKVKKRIQDPLNSKSAAVLLNKLIIPLETLTHRHLDPISKTVPMHEDIPFVTNNFDHKYWERPYASPRFFGKSINSAEMNMVDTDYNKVMKHNGIPQRLQKPLNTDISDEVFQDSKIIDIGNIKFLMKDIDGSGFSIGFNQYTDEAPDPETMKLFSGLENVIQTYHQQYDQETQQEKTYNDAKNMSTEEADDNKEQSDKFDQHIVQKRSIQNSKENDHQPNNNINVYDHNILPFKDYNEMFNIDKPSISKIKNMKVYRMNTAQKSAFIIDENVFEKNLRPAQILSIADLLQRKKRSLKVKKISNVKIKSKMNRYLNTKKMASKSVFMNKKQTKRTKRQIDKIRIIARDMPQQDKSEDENMFLISDEKLFADRALVTEVELPEMEPSDKPHSIEHYDTAPPQKEEEPFEVSQTQTTANEDSEDHFDIFSPYVYPVDAQSDFTRRARHNSLMSKYPHIFMEETSRLARANDEESISDHLQQHYNAEATTMLAMPTIIDIPSPNEQDLITDLISPPKDLNNYRVSVKIRPRNSTNMSGYKEVHTSINKSYNKNGLIYTSLVNVSQLSKVEKVNKTLSRRDNNESVREQKAEQEDLKQQQDIIKTLIQQHKHRLEMQLKHLQTERQKLELLYGENPENASEKTLSMNSKKIQKALQDEARKKRNREVTTAQPTNVETTTTRPPTTLTTTTEHLQTTTEDVIKTKMIETIQRNENVTNELLKKIDLNTGILKIFLGKLIATIDVPSRKATETVTLNGNETKESSTNTPVIATKQPITNDRVENGHIPFNFEDYHLIPNMLFRNLPKPANNSYGIPFVYAVQHPYGVMPNKDNMASMVYHGHILTNTVNDKMKRDKKAPANIVMKDKVKIIPNKKKSGMDFWKPKPGEKVLHDFVVNKNNSPFFLDDTPNDFKVSGDQAKNVFTIGAVNASKV